MPHVRAVCSAGLAALAAAGAARAGVIGPFDFIINPATSRLRANASCSVSATGTATGNFSAANPGGTRTMPGLDGPFGPADNAPVPIVFAGELGDVIQPAVSGGLRATLDEAASTLQFSGLSANLLASPAAPFGASVLFFTENGFRTRNPDLDYPGGSPLQLPLVTGTLTSLSVSQVGVATGTLTPGPQPGEYQYSIATMVNLSASYVYLGQPFAAPPQMAQPLEFSGTLRVDGATAILSSLHAANLSNSVSVPYQHPPFAFDLTQVSTPDQTAHLLMDLLVNNVTAGFSGELTLDATGTLVPAPAAALPLVGLAAALRRRRR